MNRPARRLASRLARRLASRKARAAGAAVALATLGFAAVGAGATPASAWTTQACWNSSGTVTQVAPNPYNPLDSYKIVFYGVNCYYEFSNACHVGNVAVVSNNGNTIHCYA